MPGHGQQNPCWEQWDDTGGLHTAMHAADAELVGDGDGLRGAEASGGRAGAAAAGRAVRRQGLGCWEALREGMRTM